MGYLRAMSSIAVLFCCLSSSIALCRETSAEKEAALVALRRVLVGLEEGAFQETKPRADGLKVDFLLANRHFPEPDKSQLVAELDRVLQKGSQADAMILRDRLIKVSGIDLAPAQTPDLASAGQIYKEQCAACHGVMGEGNGVLAPKMNLKPQGFKALLEGSATPFRFLNVLLVGGRPATVMPSFKEKHELEMLWSLAFYVASLRSSRDELVTQDVLNKMVTSGLSLTILAKSTDTDLREWVKKAVPEIADNQAKMAATVDFLRVKGPFSSKLPRK